MFSPILPGGRSRDGSDIKLMASNRMACACQPSVTTRRLRRRLSDQHTSWACAPRAQQISLNPADCTRSRLCSTLRPWGSQAGVAVNWILWF